VAHGGQVSPYRLKAAENHHRAMLKTMQPLQQQPRGELSRLDRTACAVGQCHEFAVCPRDVRGFHGIQFDRCPLAELVADLFFDHPRILAWLNENRAGLAREAPAGLGLRSALLPFVATVFEREAARSDQLVSQRSFDRLG
jgi:hypothetical protein